MSNLSNFEGSIFVCGQTGMGKTQYLRRVVLPLEVRCVIFDHMAEYTNLPGWSYFYEWEKLCDYIGRNEKGYCRAVYMPVEATLEHFCLFCRLPFATFSLNLVCDELDQYATPISFPNEFKRVIHFGRHFNSRFVGASRRASDVSRVFTSQCYKIVCFRQSEPRDITYLRSIIGEEALRLTELEPLHYIQSERGEITEGSLNVNGYNREISIERRHSKDTTVDRGEIREGD